MFILTEGQKRGRQNEFAVLRQGKEKPSIICILSVTAFPLPAYTSYKLVPQTRKSSSECRAFANILFHPNPQTPSQRNFYLSQDPMSWTRLSLSVSFLPLFLSYKCLCICFVYYPPLSNQSVSFNTGRDNVYRVVHLLFSSQQGAWHRKIIREQ